MKVERAEDRKKGFRAIATVDLRSFTDSQRIQATQRVASALRTYLEARYPRNRGYVHSSSDRRAFPGERREVRFHHVTVIRGLFWGLGFRVAPESAANAFLWVECWPRRRFDEFVAYGAILVALGVCVWVFAATAGEKGGVESQLVMAMLTALPAFCAAWGMLWLASRPIARLLTDQATFESEPGSPPK